MIMNHEGFGRSTETAAAAAIRAVEDQLTATWKDAPPEAQESRRQFFDLLDGSRDMIFKGIKVAATSGKRKFYPGTLPGFNSGCDKIFGYGFGQFDVAMLNAWLYSRDLKHLFMGTTKVIEW